MKSHLRQGGFTLLELLLAMALSAVLLASISSSIWHHYKTRASAQLQIEDSRALLVMSRALRLDLSLFTSSPSNNIDPESIQNATISERFLNFNYTFQYETVAIHGNRDYLALGRTIPTDKSLQTAKRQQQLGHQCIIWSSHPTEKLRVPFLKQSQEIGYLAMPSTSFNWHQQVIRRHCILLGNPCQSLGSSSYPLTSSTMQFRYLDQDQWLDTWDSVTQKRLPQAIEVEVTNFSHSQTVRLLFNLTLESTL